MARLCVPVGGWVRKLRAVRELASSPSKGGEKMRIFGGSPGNDGMELAAAALAAHDIAVDKGLLIDRLFTHPVDCFLCHHD
jgi:hypothetical protein